MTIFDMIEIKPKIYNLCEDAAEDAYTLIDSLEENILVCAHHHYDRPKFSIFSKARVEYTPIERLIDGISFDIDPTADSDAVDLIVDHILTYLRQTEAD